jgi:uncharacterized protein YceK
MRHIISILFLLSLAFCAGCGTIVAHVPDINDPDVPTTGVYRGVRYDAYALGHYGGRYSPANLAVADLPVSVVVDTIMLPYDLKHSKEDKPNPGAPRTNMRTRKEIFDDSELWAQLTHLTCDRPQNADGTGSKRFRIQIFALEDATDSTDGVDVGGKAWVSEDQGAEQLYSLVISLPQNMLRGQKRDISIEKLHVDEAKHSVRLVVRIGLRK